MKTEREYTADLIPDPDEFDQPIEFSVSYDPENEDQPWMVSSDLGCDTHHTLAQVLFWELQIPDGENGGHISDQLKNQILADFAGLPSTLDPES